MGKDVIIALDFDSKDKVLDFLNLFKEEVYVKVGMELFYKEGPAMIRELKEKGHKVFLDFKLHDIPNTVAMATKSLIDLNPDMINYQIAGGGEMLKRSTQEIKESGKNIIPLGITMLTSTSEKVMHDEILIREDYSMKQTVLKYSEVGKRNGLQGVVCSAFEVPIIKENLGQDFLTITPGIRINKVEGDDQQRIVTPEEARELGSDYIVVGRPIIKSKDPYNSYYEIRKMFLGE